MAEPVPTAEELTFLRELRERKVRFMVAGMSAAVLQGAPIATDDLDLWFSALSDPGIEQAARKAGGVLAWRASPPMLLGKGLDHIDIVIKLDGLRTFDAEYANARDLVINNVRVKVLPIERVIVSKRAAGRPKDLAALPALEATVDARRATGRK